MIIPSVEDTGGGISPPGSVIVVTVPLDGLLDGLSRGDELEVRQVFPQLGVTRSLLELTVSFVRQELHFAFKVKSLEDHHGHVLYRDLVLLISGQDDGVYLLVLPEDPDGEPGQVQAVNELSERSSSPPDLEGGSLLLGLVGLVDQAGNDMALLDVEVVVRPEHVTGDDGGEHAAVLLVVGLVLDVDHPLGVGVAEVGGVRRTVVDHGLVYGVGRLVGEDAGGEAGDQLGHSELVTGGQDVVVHLHVVLVEITVGAHVGEESPDPGGEMDHVGGTVLLEQGERLGLAEMIIKNYQERPPPSLTSGGRRLYC